MRMADGLCSGCKLRLLQLPGATDRSLLHSVQRVWSGSTLSVTAWALLAHLLQLPRLRLDLCGQFLKVC